MQKLSTFKTFPSGLSSADMKSCTASTFKFVFRSSKGKCKELEEALKSDSGK